MNTDQIYDILISKPHNPHYLKRYFRFIFLCKVGETEYSELHHICPKAKDLFPEFSDLKIHIWNVIKLSARQHIIAHILLWKAYGGSQALAVNSFFTNNANTNPKSMYNRKIPTSIGIRYHAKLREDFRKYQYGKSNYKDINGKRYFIETNSPLIDELSLVNVNTGLVPTERMIAGNSKISEFWTGRMRYMTRVGVYHGAYLKDDPIIQQLDLIPLRTQAQVDQNAARTILASEARTGTNIYTNGVEEMFCNEPPDETWYLGRKPRSDEWELKRKEATAAVFKNSTVYNDGIKHYYIQEGDYIDPSWTKGMKPQKERKFTFTDGITTIKCTTANKPDGFSLLRFFKS